MVTLNCAVCLEPFKHGDTAKVLMDASQEMTVTCPACFNSVSLEVDRDPFFFQLSMFSAECKGDVSVTSRELTSMLGLTSVGMKESRRIGRIMRYFRFTQQSIRDAEGTVVGGWKRKSTA